MDIAPRRDEINGITEQIIGCAFEVSNVLGHGFLEKVYEKALAHELGKAGLAIEQQKPIQVCYDGVAVGDFVADFVVEGQVIIELKAARNLDKAHMAQCMNYLKATGHKICLLINFGQPKIEVKRIVRDF